MKTKKKIRRKLKRSAKSRKRAYCRRRNPAPSRWDSLGVDYQTKVKSKYSTDAMGPDGERVKVSRGQLFNVIALYVHDAILRSPDNGSKIKISAELFPEFMNWTGKPKWAKFKTRRDIK